ncbi:hypothetical protein [Tautonia plasticadhaerens]|uniref:Uncharacterized protein n=1 Tax=Tautonia plasticadhaerens TaxID=2527974 RepID=A0A518H823_9BACT|nr:hypothetical protein [Tautonia plasticadhaerens]QDV37009.1 hypothetical protein ElP_49420 [Tautonia plasticadhaerens]
MAADPKADRPAPPPEIDSVKIFSYPKVIFLWPTMVFALICGLGMLVVGSGEPVRGPMEADPVIQVEGEEVAGADAVAGAPIDDDLPPEKVRRFSSWQNIIGVVFLIVFAVNMIVMSLDFPRFTLIAVILFVLMMAFLLLYLASQGVDFLSPLTTLSRFLYFTANAGFYFAIASVLGVIFLIIWATRRLDYWEVRANEVLHHHGPLSDLERYPTIQLKFSKEIPDILEFLLGLGAGRLVLNFSTADRQIVLDHVLFINAKEEQLKQIMSRLRVDA